MRIGEEYSVNIWSVSMALQRYQVHDMKSNAPVSTRLLNSINPMMYPSIRGGEFHFRPENSEDQQWFF
jgi:hypothetical protein